MSILIPRATQAMVDDVRSKRGAVPVKEIDARLIDAQLCAQAVSWVMAELVRLDHVDGEAEVAAAMAALVRTALSMIEVFGDETVVTGDVPCDVEILLLVAQAEPAGLERREVGLSSKYSPPAVTKALQRLERLKQLHKTRDGVFHITGPGEASLAAQLVPKAA